jgi:hypothetical protein
VPAATDTYYSFTATSGATYHYLPAKSTAAAAEAACNQLTAHLAWYTSLAEQQEVERVRPGRWAPGLHGTRLTPQAAIGLHARGAWAGDL